MNIEWIKCSERMPPDDMTNVIARWIENNKPELCFGSYINLKVEPEFAFEYEWTEFTQEKWEFLNK